MSNNAYVDFNETGWYELSTNWSVVWAFLLNPALALMLVVVSVWMGARCRRLPRARFCDARQFDGRSGAQGHICWCAWWRGPDCQEGQAERQPAVQLLLRPRRLDMDDRLRVLWRRLEVRHRLRREIAHRRQPVLPHWHGLSFFPFSPQQLNWPCAEPLQQPHVYVPAVGHLDYRPQSWRFARFATRSHVRFTRRGIRGARREDGCGALAPSLSR